MTRPVQLGLLEGADKAVGPMLNSVVHGSNADLIAAVASLYLTGSVLDVTYGRGMWWQRYQPEAFTWHDLALDGVDFRQLPHPDRSFDTVCFDPPYVPRQGGSDAPLARDQDYRDRFGLAESRGGGPAPRADRRRHRRMRPRRRPMGPREVLRLHERPPVPPRPRRDDRRSPGRRPPLPRPHRPRRRDRTWWRTDTHPAPRTTRPLLPPRLHPARPQMTTLRITHTACDQPADLTADNRLLHPDTDEPHQCTGPAGPWTATRNGRRWTLQYALDPHATQPHYDTETAALQEAQQRNGHYERARAPKPPQPQQAALFNQQENTR